MMKSCVVVLIALVLELESVVGFAQHPGAYSSPHYAKKSSQYSKPYNQPGPYNEPEYQRVDTVDRFATATNKHQEFDLKEEEHQQHQQYQQQQPQQLQQQSNHLEVYENQTGRSSGFMETASSFLKGRGGQMLADIARELIARSTGATSQVLSLNLTNLVILVVLKALILAAGMFGAGAWNHGYARSLNGDDNSVWIEEKELALWSGYLEGGNYECLAKAACESPLMADRYASGAQLLLTAAKMLNGIVPYDHTYEKIVEQVKEATKWASSGNSCTPKFNCT